MGLEVGGRDAGRATCSRASPAAASARSCSARTSTRSTTAAPIEPVLVDGGWENANDGILGADNKAAVAVILELARRCSVEGSPVGLELLFTVAEEDALAGRQGSSTPRSCSPSSATSSTTRRRSARSSSRRRPTTALAAEFHGQRRPRRHPPRGRPLARSSPPPTRSRAMPHGRIDEQTTANVGSIHGGVGVHQRRPRALPPARRGPLARPEPGRGRAWPAMVDAHPRRRRRTRECDVDVDLRAAVRRLPPEARARRRSSPPRRRCAPAATSRGGSPPAAASDANALEAGGFPCVNLANGTERNHEPTERVSVAALEGMLDVAFALLDEAAAGMSSALRAHRRRDRATRARSSPSARRRFRHEDGEEVEREIVAPHRARSASSRTTASTLWLVRQPREAVGVAGPARDPGRQARRRGRGRRWRPPSASWPRRSARPAEHWEHAAARSTPRRASPTRRSTSSSPPGCRTRRAPEAEEDERIDVEVRPLAELDAIIDETQRLEDADRAARAAPPPAALNGALHRQGERAAAAANHRRRGHRRPRPAVRAPRARLPRLPRVRARAVAQHARGLPLRPAAVRRCYLRTGRDALRRRRTPTSPAFVSELADGRRREAAGRARDAAAQGRLPALLLPPPAPPGPARRRPDRRPARAAPEPQAAAGAHARRGRQAARAAARAPSRPRCATARCSS